MTRAADAYLTIGFLLAAALVVVAIAVGITATVSSSLWWLIPCAVVLACWLLGSARSEWQEHRGRQTRGVVLEFPRVGG